MICYADGALVKIFFLSNNAGKSYEQWYEEHGEQIKQSVYAIRCFTLLDKLNGETKFGRYCGKESVCFRKESSIRKYIPLVE